MRLDRKAVCYSHGRSVNLIVSLKLTSDYARFVMIHDDLKKLFRCLIGTNINDKCKLDEYVHSSFATPAAERFF